MKLFSFKKLRLAFIDIRNYLILIQTVKKNRNTADWQRFNLQVDWVYRIYTVFNPSPADKGDDDEMIKIKLGERMIPCHKYIDSIGLGEIVGVSGEQIPDSQSYLVVYYPLFSYLTVWRVIRTLIIFALLWIYGKDIYDFFLSAYTYLNSLINF